MKKNLFYTFCILGTLSFFSCEKTLSTVNNLDLKHEPMLAISFTNDTLNYLTGSVSLTKNITGTNNQVDFIQNAGGYIYEDGQLKDSLTFDNFTDLYHSTQNNFISGKTYKLIVKHPSYKNTEAIDIMPAMITPAHEYIPQSKKFYIQEYERSVLCDEINLTISDDGNTADYYSIQVFGKDTFNMGRPYSLGILSFDSDAETEYDNDDPTSNESLIYGKLIWKDKNFNGTNKKITVYIPNDFGSQQEIFCVVTHMSENYYRYIKTYGRYLNSEGNPFAEPVQVYSNTVNGAGIFALKADYIIPLK